jgi:hypothetical protein
MNSQQKSIYCAAPWIHATIGMDGGRKLCCEAASFEQDKYIPLKEFWNSPNMKRARLKMMTGSAPSEHCSVCLENPNIESSPRKTFKISAEQEKYFKESTAVDGSFNEMPYFYDYRISNICNLSCRMCNQNASSKIANATLKLSSTTLKERETLIYKPSLNADEILPELIESIRLGSVRELYFASGEVVLQKEFFTIVDECLTHKMAEQIKMMIHTNLSLPIERVKTIFEKLKNFEEIELYVSIDGTEEDAEFIRDGLKWNRFVKNLDYISSLSQSNLKVTLTITLTIPTMLHIKNLCLFIAHYKMPYLIAICHLDGTSALYSPLALRREQLNTLVEYSKNEIEAFENDPLFNNVYEVFDKLNKATLLEETNVSWISDLKGSLFKVEQLDQKLKRQPLFSYYQNYPILKEWVSEIQIAQSSVSDSEYYNTFHQSQNLGSKAIYFNFDYEEKLNDLTKKYFTKNEIKYLSMIGSASTPLNKFLSRFSNSSSRKYALYEDFVNHLEATLLKYPSWSIKKSEYLGVFSFLLKKYKLSKVSKFLDFIFYPIRSIISFHYYVQIEVDLTKMKD